MDIMDQPVTYKKYYFVCLDGTAPKGDGGPPLSFTVEYEENSSQLPSIVKYYTEGSALLKSRGFTPVGANLTFHDQSNPNKKYKVTLIRGLA